MIIAIIAIVILVLLVIIWFAMYNGLVKKRNTVNEAYAQIDTQLQRRGDLIPNLVSTVKGYANHEAKVFHDIAELRSATDRARATGNVQDASQAEAVFGRTMATLRATAEAYPELQASRNFQQLQEELAATENKVGFARQYYNSSTNNYNTAIQSVPTNIVASVHGFRPFGFFQVEESKRQAPDVSF